MTAQSCELREERALMASAAITRSESGLSSEATRADFPRARLAAHLRTVGCTDFCSYLRLWSAGCAAGQEPYSLAMTLLGLMPDARHHDIRILAADIDPSILGGARNTHLCPADLAQIGPYNHRQCVDKTASPPVARPDVKALVQIRQLNLMSTWPMRCRFAVILCRNVLMYLASDARNRLLARLANALVSGGWRFLGHAERLCGPAADHFAARGGTAYQHLGVP